MACYILFKGSRSHVFFHEEDLELEVLNKGICVSMYDLTIVLAFSSWYHPKFYISMKV